MATRGFLLCWDIIVNEINQLHINASVNKNDWRVVLIAVEIFRVTIFIKSIVNYPLVQLWIKIFDVNVYCKWNHAHSVQTLKQVRKK